MRAIVEVRGGRSHGKKAVLDPGASLRVGRIERAGLVVDRDDELSGLHFELTWDGATCRLRDLKSLGGTSLNGEPVAEGLVSHGDWIKAGATIFLVYFEEHTPTPRRLRDDASVTAEHKEHALAALEGETAPLFAVLDAARDDRILEVLRESVEECRSLYEGVKGQALADVAPYLVSLPKGSQLLRRLVNEGWGRRWGIYLTCKRPFKEVRSHLRRFLMVEDDERGKRMYFRYYDPEVLGGFLGDCPPRQRAQIFSELEAFVVEGPRGVALRFARS